MEENVAVGDPVENFIPTITLVTHIKVVANGEIGVDGDLDVENSNSHIENAAIVEGIALSSFDALPLDHSCGIIEGAAEASEPNICLVKLVASPIVNPDSYVDVCDGEAEVFDDFVPVGLGDCVVVSPMAELVHVNSGEVGNALDTPTCFNASFSDGFVHLPKTVVPLIEVPIFVMSNDVLFARLVSKSRDYAVMYGDWLDIDNSSDGGEEITEQDLNSRGNFELSIIQFVQDDVSKKSAKRDRQKSKKK